MIKLKLKTGNSAKVISGKFRNLISEIQRIKYPRVYLTEATRKQYDKSPAMKKKSQLKSVFVPIHFSNVVA